MGISLSKDEGWRGRGKEALYKCRKILVGPSELDAHWFWRGARPTSREGHDTGDADRQVVNYTRTEQSSYLLFPSTSSQSVLHQVFPFGISVNGGSVISASSLGICIFCSFRARIPVQTVPNSLTLQFLFRLLRSHEVSFLIIIKCGKE